jgi:hypothetical protein
MARWLEDLQQSPRPRYRSTNAPRETSMKRRELVDELRQDTQLAIRLFQRSPMFFSAAVLTLAVGIGANGAVFSILQAALLQPLPYRDPSELVILERTRANQARSAELRFESQRSSTS